MKRIITLGFLAMTFMSFGQSNHTITIDGTINTASGEMWTVNERFETSTSTTTYGYITWDANYLYVAWPQVDFDGYNQACFIVIDVDPTTSNGTTNLGYEQWFRGSTVNVPFNADFIFMVKENNSSLEEHTYQYYNGNWEKDGANGSTDYRSSFDHAYGNATGNKKDIELRINRSDIGIGTAGAPIKINVYCKDLDQNNGWGYIHRIIPNSASTDGTNDKTLTHYYSYLLTDGNTPNNGNYYDGTIQNWTGSSDNYWGTSSNWSENSVPSSTDLVLINSGTPIINESTSSPASCYDLVIMSGASLTINVNKALTVNGTFTNNGTASSVYIDSDNTGNGSLKVTGNVTGEITVKRWIPQFTSANDGWHLIGCPVTSFAVANTDWDPTHIGIDNDLYYWDETQNLWMNYRTATFDFAPEKGYLAANDADLNHSFTGTPNNDDVGPINLTYTSSKGNGWNLLGNPYPSALIWNDGNWSLTDVGGVAKVLSGTDGTYSDLSSGGIIPSTNGFFVQATANTTITIPAASRTHNSHNNYKNVSSENETNTLHFIVTNDANSYKNKTTIGFKENATETWDIAFDSRKLFGYESAPELWTVSDNEIYSTNYLPLIKESITVPLGFKAGVSSLFHITVKGQETFGNNSEMYLEDVETGTLINLKTTSQYDFSSAAGIYNNRFILHFSNITSTPEISKDDNILIYEYQNRIVLKSKNKNLNGTVDVLNMLGQKILTQEIKNTTGKIINTYLDQGIYIVRYRKTDGYVQTQKVIIN